MAGRILMVTDGPASVSYATGLLTRLRNAKYSIQVAPTAYAGPSALAFVSELAWTTLSGHTCFPIGEINAEALRKHDLLLLAPVSRQVLDIFMRGDALKSIQEAGRPVVAILPRILGEEPIPQDDFDAAMPPRSTLIQGNTPLELGAMGRLAVPSIETAAMHVDAALSRNDFAGRRILVTAGPTAEDIDPVRYLTNRSSGKMGVALAAAAAIRGASVLLVHGPMQVTPPEFPRLRRIGVRSAEEMHRAVMENWSGLDIAILAAAVADFRPDHYAEQKIRKIDGQSMVLHLRRTPDILAELGSSPEHPFLVGFAAESNDVEANAIIKMRRKHCDMICANDIMKPGCGFSTDTNQITIYSPGYEPHTLKLKEKSALADDILAVIAERFPSK